MTQKVSKSSINLSHFKFRRLVLALVFLFAAHGVWGETYTWTGAENAVITNLNNWKTATEDPATSLPGNTDSVIIPSGCSYYPSITGAMVNNIASIKVDGQLTIGDDFTLAKIDADSSGTLIVNGKLTNSSQFIAENLSITCGSLELTDGLKGKKIVVNGSSEITSTSWLVAAGSDGITFGDTVTVDASGGQFVLAGNVYASTDISINVTSGMLNHVLEGGAYSAWDNNHITVDLKNNGCSLGLQGSSYNIKVSADSGDVYFVGSGTIASLNDTGAGCNIHFGDGNDSENNTITFGADIIFHTTGDIVLDESCKGLEGAVTLSGINNISNLSAKLSDLEDKIVPTISLVDGATISGNDVNFSTVTCVGAVIIQPATGNSFSFDSLTCNGDATVNGNNTIKDFTASGLGGKTLTINGTQTITGDVSLSGTDSSKLTLAGSGSLALTNTLTAQYLNFDATAPSATSGKAYASNSTGTAIGWVVVDGNQHVWNGGSGDWDTPANWLPQTAPGSTDDVIINDGNPVIKTTETVKSIVINGGKLTINSEKSLTLSADAELNTQTKIDGDGSLILSSGKTFTIPEGKTFNINIVNNGTLSSSYSTAFSKSFTNTGTASFVNGLTVDKDFSDSGSFSGTITLTEANNHTFKGINTTDYDVILAGSVATNFKDSINFHSLNVTSYTGNITFSGTGDQTIPAGTYGTITVDKTSDTFISAGDVQIETFNQSGDVSFLGTANITTYKQNSGNASFTGNLTVNSYTHTAGDLTFGGDATFTNGVDFHTAQLSVTGGNNTDSLKIEAPSITADSIVCTDNNLSYLELNAPGGINISGNIGSSSQKYNTVILNAGSNDITVGGNIYTSSIGVTCKEVAFNNSIYVGSVTVNASTELLINGMEAQSLSLTAPSIKLGSTIKLSSDFIIDFPLTLIADTTFDINGKIIVKNDTRTGSINSDSTARTLILKASNGIEIQNGNSLGGTAPLKSITIDSDLDLTSGASFTTTTGDDTGTYFSSSGGSVTGSGTLAITGDLANSGAWNFGVPITVTGNVTDAGTWTANTGNTITFNGTGEQTFTPKEGTQYKDIIVSNTLGSFSTSGTLKAASFTATGDITIPTATIETTGDVIFNGTVTSTDSLSIKANELQFKANASVNNITMEATAITSHDITVTGNWTNNGSFTASAGTVKLTTSSSDTSRVTLSGANNFHDLNLDRNVTVTGSNSMNNLTMNRNNGDAADKGNIYFDADTKQTINGKLDFKGLTSKRLLAKCTTDGSTWEIECTSGDSNTHVLQNINLRGCKNLSSYPLVVKDPAGTANNSKSQDSGENTNIYFLGHAYTWTGAYNTDPTNWNDARNWTPKSIPGKGTVINIQNGRTNYPVLTETLDLYYDGDYKGSITIAAGTETVTEGKLNLAGQNLTVGTITNNGLVQLLGTGTQTITATMVNGANSTVEYTGTGADTSVLPWDGNSTTAGNQYANVVFNRNVDINDVINITATGTITIDCASVKSTGNQTYNGTVSLNQSAVFTAKTTDATPVNQTITFNGDVTGSANLTLEADTDINTDKITTTGTQTYNGLVTVSKDTELAGSGINYVSDITGTGRNLTIDTPSFTSTIASTGLETTETATVTLSTLKIKQNTTIDSSNGTYIVLDVSTIEKSAENSTETLTFGNTTTTTIKLKDGITVKPDLTNTKTAVCLGAATFGGTVENNGTLTASSGITTFKADVDLSGTFNHSGGTVVLDPTATTMSLTGEPVFYDLKAENLGGITITFDSGTTTINNKLTLKGSSGSKLIINGSGGTIYAETHEIENVNVSNSIADAAKPLTAKSSTDGGLNVNWSFPGFTYEWIAAATDSDWNNAANWNPASVPGLGTKIKINPTTNPDNYPKLSVAGSPSPLDLSGGTYIVEITVEEGAAFDIADKSLVLGTSTTAPGLGKITNKGTVILNGVSGQAISNAQMINSGDDSTINYSGTSNTVNLVWDGDLSTSENDFKNLIIANTVNTTADIKVSKNLTLSKDIDTLTGSLSVTGETNINTGCATIKTTGNQSYTGEVKINDAAGATLNTSSGEISLSTVNGTSLTVTGNLKVTGTTSINTSGDQTYNCAIYGGGTLNLDSTANSGNGTIAFNNDIDGTTLLSSLSTKGDVTIDCENIKTSGNQSYNSEIKISKANGTTLTGSNIIFYKDVVDTSTSLAVDGNLKISGEVTINTSGTQAFNTINGTTEDTDKLTLNSTGLITLGGNVGSTAVLLKEFKTTTGSNAKINCASIKTSGEQSYSGTLDLGTPTLVTMEGSSVTFNDSVSDTDAATTLEVKAPATINCSGITTSGNQQYDSTVTLGTATVLTAQAGAPAENKNITFKGNVTGTTTADTALTINANTVVASPATEIKTNGNQTYNGNTTISSAAAIESTGDSITFAEGYQLSVNAATEIKVPASKTINFNSTTTGSAKLTTAGAGTAKFTGNVTNLNSLETQAVDFNCETLSTTGSQTYNGAATVSRTGGTTISSSGGAITFASTSSLTGTTNKLKVETGTGETNSINFEGTIGAPAPGSPFVELEIGTARTTTFINPVYIGTFKDTSTSGNIIFQNGGTISNDVNLMTNGNVSIAGTLNLAGFSHYTVGKTILTGTMQATGVVKLSTSEIDGGTINSGSFSTENLTVKNTATIKTTTTQDYNGTVTINENSTLYIQQATNSTFADFVSGNKIQIGTAQNTNFNGYYGSVQLKEFEDTENSGNISFNSSGSIAAESGQIFNTNSTVSFGYAPTDSFIIGSSAESTTNLTHTAGETQISGTLNAAIAKLKNTKLTGTLNAKTMLYGDLTSYGTAKFAQDLFVLGDAATTTLNATTSITADKDIIIAKDSGKDITVSKVISTAGNFVLYSGDLELNANLTTQKDVVLVGTAYDATDSSTSYTNAYAYNTPRPSGWSTPLYVYEGTSTPQTLASITLPDTTTVSTKAGSLTAASDVVIHVGKNFYANGITMNASGTWYIDILSNSDSSVCFAEAYNCNVTNCTVRKHTGNNTTGTAAQDYAQIAAENCTLTNCTNWDSDDFEITDAWTVRDNAVYIKFNRPVRNKKGELNTFVENLLYAFDSENDTEYKKITSDADGTTLITAESDEVYIIGTSGKTWNTDATGSDSGASESTDRNGNHRTSAKPYLDIPRSLGGSSATETTQSFVITDRFGKRLKNYSKRVNPSGSDYNNIYTSVLDHTGPVLYSVRTGQELHAAYDSSVGESCQHSYDGHNFLEFRYSEPVDFVSATDTDTPLNIEENFQVTQTDQLGYATNSAVTVTIAGLGQVSGVELYTGSQGHDDKEVSALYRNFLAGNAIDDYAIRLSIAGYTNGTVTDSNGFTYKNWVGYIENASQFADHKVTFVAPSTKINPYVQDRSAAKNKQIEYLAHQTEPEIQANATGLFTAPVANTYGLWDLSEPVFAILRNNNTLVWASEMFNDGYQAEAIGNNTGMGATLDRIEFHVFDNTPDFSASPLPSEQPEWFTETGWCIPGTIGTKDDLYKTYSHAADVFGGARPYANDPASTNPSANRTAGGLRYSTVCSSAAGFSYGVGSNLSSSYINKSFDTSRPAFGGATSLVFTGTSAGQRTATDLEGLYFALPLVDTTLDITTTFTVKYDDSRAFITDFAGNRLKTKTFGTVDRTPPSFDFSVCPVGEDQLEVIFVKALCIDSGGLHFLDNDTGNQKNITQDYATLITKCFDFIKIDDSGNGTVVSDLSIDSSVPAKISISTRENGSSFTTMIFKLNRKITLEDIKTIHLRVKYHPDYGEVARDFFTKHPNSKITFIQDETGNSIQMYTAHALSDFAIGVIDPLYAYDSSMTNDDGTIISDGLFHTNVTDGTGSEDLTSWAVHDWDRDQHNYGTLPANRSLAIVANTDDGQDDTNTLLNFRIYLSNNPDSLSVSNQYNKDLEPDPEWRIWLPELSSGIFTPLAEKNNTNFAAIDGTSLDGTKLATKTDTRIIFDISKEVSALWASGDQVSFLFGLTDSDGNPVKIMHSPVLDIDDDEGKKYLLTSVKMPLFALRQTDPQDLMSLDLWSFRLKDIINQRGGVTILNNVINSVQGEKVVVKVNQPENGNLNVIVMTLDGNIVDYLQRGESQAGEHFYSWNGSNRKGNPVARGMYFIRVTGPGLDETRKVMVVKD